MKTFTTLLVCLALTVSVSGQNRACVPSGLRDIAIKKERPAPEPQVFPAPAQHTPAKAGFVPEETVIGTTWYDDQSNSSIQNRMVIFPDGTMGATWTRGMDYAGGFPDRGSGYNYFDGSAWGTDPTNIVEDERTGWPSYAPLGEDGEIVGAHTNATGIKISKRTTKGEGAWEYYTHSGPMPDHAKLIWNRLITSGTTHERIHMLALTASTDYQGTPYMGLNGALVYSLSPDGGNTWLMDNVILDGTGADYYTGYYGDTYTFAPPKGDIIAFVAGESWYDLYLMKSTDGGETFTKTLIWEHPYPFWTPYTATDTFYCADGAHSVVIDENDMAHVAFGINRSQADGTQATWFPFVDGIAYWNENMPAFSSDHHALDPYGHPNSELIEDYNLIGWTQDVDNDGQITFASNGIETMGLYYLGLSSMPQLVTDAWGGMFLIFNSLTETYDNGTQNYRHIWARYSPDGGTTWLDFVDLNSDLIHIFDECVYPSCATYNDNFLYLVHQTDGEPGLHVWGDLDAATENKTTVMKIQRHEITGVRENKPFIHDYDVYQNYPNPFDASTTIPVNLRKTCSLTLEVFDYTGKTLEIQTISDARPGLNKFTVSAENLSDGIYFYKVNAGDNAIVKKMVVK
ncbi:MAG: T9SS type A sorting domain-containing protein [Bacteroidales bacterium]|nr:T9SS type A sorting domain-containing protein [Bacteroidales bacterium]